MFAKFAGLLDGRGAWAFGVCDGAWVVKWVEGQGGFRGLGLVVVGGRLAFLVRFLV